MSSGLESLYPDNTRDSINMHYQSESTHEFGTLRLIKGMPLDSVLAQYSSQFPIECRAFLDQVRATNQNLHRPGGMSKEGIIMAIGKVPKLLFMAFEFLDPDFWLAPENFRAFIRAYPKFAVGDHSRKSIPTPGAAHAHVSIKC